MRVNVYNEEITDRVERTTDVANTVTFTGIRFLSEKPLSIRPETTILPQ